MKFGRMRSRKDIACDPVGYFYSCERLPRLWYFMHESDGADEAEIPRRKGGQGLVMIYHFFKPRLAEV